ncbi:YlcI/YnfO family protein [Mixta gaviniae]|uniref:DUF3950 domain-containing protein n=1 Tax=Mixta gaviniae TaxID=665914 RepID=A0A2L0IDX6_9GAMM|nr:YlcI/YnfO family protein [Mixta gaviniae]AUX92717.1 DUF3950 domain-containing protein [Mixta gaviniae]
MQKTAGKNHPERSTSTRKNIRIEDDLLRAINAVAGTGKFSAWVKEACRQRLIREGRQN